MWFLSLPQCTICMPKKYLQKSKTCDISNWQYLMKWLWIFPAAYKYLNKNTYKIFTLKIFSQRLSLLESVSLLHFSLDMWHIFRKSEACSLWPRSLCTYRSLCLKIHSPPPSDPLNHLSCPSGFSPRLGFLYFPSPTVTLSILYLNCLFSWVLTLCQ